MRFAACAVVAFLAACAGETQPPRSAPPPPDAPSDAGPSVIVLGDAGPADAGPTDAGPALIACGGTWCQPGQRCLALDSAPGVPTCVDADDCHARPLGADLFGDALSAIGLDRCTANMGPDPLGPFPDAMKHDPYRLPFYDAVHENPLRAPGWGERLVASFAGRPASAQIAEAALRLGYPIDPRHPAHAVDAQSPLMVAFLELATARGGNPDGASIIADAADVPLALQREAAKLLYALASAATLRDEAFAQVNTSELYRLGPAVLLTFADGRGYDVGGSFFRTMVFQRIVWSKLYQAAQDLAAAVEDAALAPLAGARGFAFDQQTPLGRVVISDASDQVFADAGHVLLHLDTGGADTYRYPAGASTSGAFPLSVVIDLAGDDQYLYPEATADGDSGRLPSDADGRFAQGDVAQGQTAMSRSDHARQGAGRAGVGLLYDLAGNDRYRSLRMSQGYGAFGVGVLFDAAGDDVYEAEVAAQGSAAFGIGLLLDHAGHDVRRAYAYAQGFGYARGFGALVDDAGSDFYWVDPGNPAEGGDPLYYSPQLPGIGNTSMSQGAGFGRRDDSGRSSMSGGIGLLADLGAEGDHYVGSVFAQGTGYWFGTGVLHDAGGDDLYEGKWYVRGSAAHFALALFRDEAGDDRHNTGVVRPVLTSMGQGHDFSVGWLVDVAGNDVYDAPGLALGGGNANGWGFMLDLGGDDTYSAPVDRSMGGYGEPGTAGSFRAARITLGLLLDRGGADSYTLGGTLVARENTITEAATDPLAPLGKGVHADAESGEVLVLP